MLPRSPRGRKARCVRKARKSHIPAVVPVISFRLTNQLMQDLATILRQAAAAMDIPSVELRTPRATLSGTIARVARPLWIVSRGRLMPIPPCDATGKLIAPDGVRILSLKAAADRTRRPCSELLSEYMASWMDLLLADQKLLLDDAPAKGGGACA